MKVQGIYIPLITPFANDKVDFDSYKRMLDYYIGKEINGIIPLATTGEIPTISEYEYEEIIEKTMEYNNNRLPVFIGLGGNNTKEVINKLKIVEKYKVDGILSVCPYYSRPDQRGIYEHFLKISEATALDIVLYNIPYRTGRNIENDTIYKLAELKNIVGVKDSCGDIKQTTDLLLNPPKDFSIMTGEDILFYTNLVYGGDGGIMASSHLRTDEFVEVYKAIKDNNHKVALDKWKELAKFIPMLFEEPNPAPIKYCLSKLGLINSDEVRLPLVEITDTLKNKLDKALSL
ncbi:4-hydroxy-tetrahydrodipicolinate synthase [Inconstantimicrobium mannanitabidum]|uniref:4-hydroxy-tetrahydrodipicolinate synthase 2 n=1 Tax=Inconstantimicrobium mannanitabidum TaxID=1604901 RepID=A0ACB5RGK9_9CLOT|nr:4-hydroxy-tetrahydrodipicolinate synthase [Clostridium sp. TW13]GKX68231.1 4-hydroxy-tetrahydrodipicolinate synthase 2 [Clostridium sp. TW13]